MAESIEVSVGKDIIIREGRRRPRKSVWNGTDLHNRGAIRLQGERRQLDGVGTQFRGNRLLITISSSQVRALEI